MSLDGVIHKDRTPYLAVERDTGYVIVKGEGTEETLTKMAKRKRTADQCRFVAGIANVPIYYFASHAARDFANRHRWLSERPYNPMGIDDCAKLERYTRIWWDIAWAVTTLGIDDIPPLLGDTMEADVVHDLERIMVYSRRGDSAVYLPESRMNWQSAYRNAFINAKIAKFSVAYLIAVHDFLGVILVIPAGFASQIKGALTIKRTIPTKVGLGSGVE